MTDNPRLQQLLDELFDSPATPEEVCASCPELLPEVKRRWGQIRRVQADIEAFFPSSSDQETSRPAIPLTDAGLPEIPGYEVQSVLGRGGMGVVYRAFHLRLQRPVALKMLLAGTHALPAQRERFARETEAFAALHHPNIVPIYDVGDFAGQPYFTMELVEGGSLAERIRGVPQPPAQAAKLAAVLADAIHEAHRHGIVHSDLKPGNVLLTIDGTLKVTDFGLAWRLDGGPELALSGVPIGTPSYMSPCQARGDRSCMGPATDIWALGAILYELLTGRPPFRSDTPAATLRQVMNDEPVPPRRLNPRIPRDLETICLKCLRKEPQNRYSSAQDLAKDLRRFERGEPIKARPVGPVELAVRWVRCQPALAIGGLMASILAVTVLWWYVERTELKATAVAYAEADLIESERLREGGDFKASAAVLRRAQDRLDEYVSPQLRDRLRRAVDTLELLTRLDTIRLRRSVLPGKDYEMDTAQADRDYEEAFRSAGLGIVQEEARVVAVRVGNSPARMALVAALDDWAVCTPDSRRRAWLLRVARLADPDPWRDRVRDPSPEAWSDRARLGELAREAPVAQESVQLLVALGGLIQKAGGREDAIAYLRRVQQAHPEDFYANNMLGDALFDVGEYGDAVGHFRAAVAVRPDSTIAWANLGVSLSQLQRWDEARVAFEESLRIDPDNGWAHMGFGEVLRHEGHTDEAIKHLERAITLVNSSSRLHRELAFAMQDQKRWGEAIAHFRAAVALQPDAPWLQYDLGMALNSPGHQDEAIEHLRKTLALDPRYPAARVNLARILINRGRVDEGISELRQAIELDQQDTLARAELRRALSQLGGWQEVQAAWREQLDAGPPNHDVWFGYAELCLFLDDETEYRRARHDLLIHFGSTTDPEVAERTGRACLLLPAPEEELRPTVALTERAVSAGRPGREFAYPYCLFAEGLARYRQGRFDDAIQLMTGEAASVMGPSPRLIVAMAQFQKGDKEEARTTLAAAISSYDWTPSNADHHDAWIAHILRREAEAMISPTPPLSRQGK
jgi:eukaryotic-like serine/threonine-protein kinase